MVKYVGHLESCLPQGQRTGTLNKYIYDRHTSPTIYWTTANELKSYSNTMNDANDDQLLHSKDEECFL